MPVNPPSKQRDDHVLKELEAITAELEIHGTLSNLSLIKSFALGDGLIDRTTTIGSVPTLLGVASDIDG
jgi:hypothetical protein